MNLPRKIEAMTAVEWYDGIVTGFIRFQDDVFLCVLLALDASNLRRCYLLMQISSKVIPIVSLSDVEDFFRSTIKTAFAVKAPLYVASDEPLLGRELILTEATNIGESDLTSLQFPRIDEAVLGTSIARWL